MTARGVFLPAGRMLEHKPENPDRTLYRAVRSAVDPIPCEVEVRAWPSPGAAALALDMQAKREPRWDDWRPWPKEGGAR